jgi:hypothetical protein
MAAETVRRRSPIGDNRAEHDLDLKLLSSRWLWWIRADGRRGPPVPAASNTNATDAAEWEDTHGLVVSWQPRRVPEESHRRVPRMAARAEAAASALDDAVRSGRHRLPQPVPGERAQTHGKSEVNEVTRSRVSRVGACNRHRLSEAMGSYRRRFCHPRWLSSHQRSIRWPLAPSANGFLLWPRPPCGPARAEAEAMAVAAAGHDRSSSTIESSLESSIVNGTCCRQVCRPTAIRLRRGP